MKQRLDVLDCLTSPLEKTKNKGMSLSSWKQFNTKKKQKHKKKFRERQVPKGHLKYSDYIKSKWWKKTKAWYFNRNKRECAVCKSPYVQLHHVKYGRFGHEKEEDLIALCTEHHKGFHEKYGVKGKMVEETTKYIIEEQEAYEFNKIARNF